MTQPQQPFALLIDLVAAIEAGQPVRGDVREWFLAGADAWVRAASSKALHEHLGLSRRLRRDYLLARQRDHLDDALRAFVETHRGSAWDLSAAFVDELRRFARRADDDPGVSRLSRSLWLAFRVGLPVPTSREHWFFLLKAIAVDGSVLVADDVGAMYPGLSQTVQARLLRAWKSSPDLQAEYPEASDFVHRAGWCDASGVYSQAFHPRNDHEAATAAVMQWLDQNFPSTANAPNSPEQEKPMTVSTTRKPEDSTDAIEAQARRDWQRDANLRAEFGDTDDGMQAWIAYRRANAAGLIKVLGGSK